MGVLAQPLLPLKLITPAQMLFRSGARQWRARSSKDSTGTRHEYGVTVACLTSASNFQLGIQSHMTIFVTFEDSSDEQNDEHLYLVDVGFGRACIPQPMPLREHSSLNVLCVDELT